MRRILAACAVATIPFTSLSAIIIRHDTPDEHYLADESGFPAIGSMFRTDNGFRDCVVTLIAPQWLITAKHCTMDPGLDQAIASGDYSVHLGVRKMAQVDRIMRMPDVGDDPLLTDVALLHLAEPVTNVAPLALYSGGDDKGRIVFFPGWGDRGTGTDGIHAEPDGKFRVAENRIEAVSGNHIVFRFDDPRSDLEQALALEGVSGPGDSGGPALISTPSGLQVAGISSFQRNFGQREGTYNVDEYYIRISSVRQWIDKTIGESSD